MNILPSSYAQGMDGGQDLDSRKQKVPESAREAEGRLVREA